MGRGGNTASADSETLGGHGCVAFEYDGDVTVFTYTGGVQSWTVPAGVASVVMHVLGAGGGGGRSGTTAFGGGGGYATGHMSVVVGQQFEVVVGGGGRRHCAADVPGLADVTARHNFSFGGGGVGNGVAPWDCTFASGGGRSAVREVGATEDLVTAGGGGGGGYVGAGGAGGGLVGVSGGGSGGSGGSQVAGGATAATEPGVAGIKYAGGWAGYSASNRNTASEGGGGGGGYYGGGAAGDNGGGGGGSSYLGSLSSTSTVAGSGRSAGATVPTVSAAPTISASAAVGSTLTASAASWSTTATTSYQWQYSADNTTFTDVAGANGLSYVPTEPGYVRVVATGSNFLGTTTSTSNVASVPDTRLSGLVVSSGSLSPVFSASRFSYAVSVGYRTRAFRVTPIARDASAALRVAGTTVVSGAESQMVDLAVGDNAIVVRVDVGGVVAETTITVTRAAAAVPSAPTLTEIREGDGKVSVRFNPPTDDGGEDIERYEYSVDGGTWVMATVVDSGFDIAGLSNDTEHSVRLRAVNSVGAGAPSSVSKGTPRRPVDTSSSVASSTSTTSTSTSVVPTTTASTTVAITRPARPNRSTTVEATIVATSIVPSVVPSTVAPADGPTSTTEAAVPSESSVATSAPPTTVAPDSSTPVRGNGVDFALIPEFGVGDAVAGARVRATASGLRPGSNVRLEVRSTPTVLDEGVTNSEGNAELRARLPGTLEPGAHLLSLSGTGPDGKPLVSVVGLEVDEAGVVAGLTPVSGVGSSLPTVSQVKKMVSSGAAGYDASRDVSEAVALAGAAVVLMSVAGSGKSARRREEREGEGESPAREEAERDESSEGSLASAEAKILQATLASGSAWGDRSRLWALPGWGALQGMLHSGVVRVERWSTLLVRVLQDGTWFRSAFGVMGVVPWVAGMVCGILAARSVDGLAVPPAFGLVVAIIVVSFFDALAGAVAWVAFTVSVVARGGVTSWFDVRTVLGLAVLFVALPLIAASFRPVVRHAADGGGVTLQRAFDYLIVPLFLSFAASSVYRALNGLSGLDVVTAGEADSVRWFCLFLVVGRMLVEDATLRWFPERRVAASLLVGRPTHRMVPIANVVLLLLLYVLTAGPYMGVGPRTWLVLGLMSLIPLAKVHKEKFPNFPTLHKWFPRGILRGVVMLYAMAYYGRWILEATGGDARRAVPLMLLPGISIGVVDCVGRNGGGWPESRGKTIAGFVLWMISFSVVAGWLTP